jgi:hypothetical protein
MIVEAFIISAMIAQRAGCRIEVARYRVQNANYKLQMGLLGE